MASPAESDTFTSLTPETAFSACVTLLMQPPQVFPVTFTISVCMVMFVFVGLHKNYTITSVSSCCTFVDD
jgi:hypothetical protein